MDYQGPWRTPMKLAGLLLLLSGWFIAITAIAILPSASARLGFFLAGFTVELLGLTLLFRAHFHVQGEP